ncbi:DUF202 domain-containing protein [Variovorax sp. J31P207]|uniref:YidH family protein n=1 Tax=Variovorax sp. J31P207 TaxID=3053510 RepID=UPI002577BE7F|nr:DUF202 domain-containing protein [Variovorax sp. J31P207]MDM0065114.1 DUF202 domain-containing protein [Variovorax sp. J31P207]
MTTPHLPDLPPDLAQKVGKEPTNTATELSGFRTQMAEHRTALSDARSHLANERTHLAYLRTALSLMSFGITINRFSIYLQQSGSAEKLNQDSFPLRDAATVGLGMVIVGVVVLLWALLRYRRVHREIVEERFEPSSLSVTLLTLAIIVMGAVSAVWLLLT